MALDGRSRRVVVVLALLFAVLLFAPQSPLVERTEPQEKTAEDVKFVYPVENGTDRLWPYTSRGKTFDEATLPINAVVYDDAETVYRLLSTGTTRERSLHWNASAETWRPGESGAANVTINGTGVHWSTSSGSARYTYIDDGESGDWSTATYQVHDGTYFGTRYHLRLYAGGSGSDAWTAIQAHHEHWDWFRLRHDVDSLGRAQFHLERDFDRTEVATELRRERWANGGAIDSDGWVTVIEVSPHVRLGPDGPDGGPQGTPKRDPASMDPIGVPLSALRRGLLVLTGTGLAMTLGAGSRFEDAAEDGRITEGDGDDGEGDGHDAGLDGDVPLHVEYVRAIRESRVGPAHLGLFAGTALLPLVVRVGAIEVERAYPGAGPIPIGAPFYVLLVLGLPAIALAFGRHLTSEDGFIASVLGFGSGIMLDYTYLGLAVIPYGAMFQRLVLLLGLGLIGAGGTRWATDPITRHRFHTLGLAIWVGALLWPLLGLG